MRKDIYERIRVLKMDEIKPNFAELAKAWGCDYRTAKKYFYQDENKPPIRKLIPSKLDPYKEMVNEKLKNDPRYAKSKSFKTAYELTRKSVYVSHLYYENPAINNELDKELESRNLNFVRYADDCVIVVKSHASANRVIHSITSWIERKLGLKVNMTKTHITTPNKLKYLGFGFWKNNGDHKYKARPHEDSIQKFKRALKKLCNRKWSIDLTYRIKKLNEVIRGWINYFALGFMKSILEKEIDPHLRTMLRIIIWKQWKKPSKREWGLKKLGIDKGLAKTTANMGDHYMWIVTRTCVSRAISKEKLTKKGLVSCLDYYLKRHALKVS